MVFGFIEEMGFFHGDILFQKHQGSKPAVTALHYTKAGRKPRGFFRSILALGFPLDTAQERP
jgi:hypothetical protein